MSPPNFQVVGFADTTLEKRLWLIRHAYSVGISMDGLLDMNATKKEIMEALFSK